MSTARAPRVLLGTLAVVLCGAGAWGAIHRYPVLGPTLANGARVAVGAGPVAVAEDVAYGLSDSVQNAVGDDTPAAYWPSPSAPAEAARAPIIPPHAAVALAGDGEWQSIADARAGAPRMHKTQLHPDPARPRAVVAIVAIDLARTDLFLVPGFEEPKSDVLPWRERPARVPSEHRGALIAAFNGGFQSIHGRWGMQVAGLTLLPAHDDGCLIAKTKTGSLHIAPFPELAETTDLAFYRQTPPCLVKGGIAHPSAVVETAAQWGTSVKGHTIIRRSGLGLDRAKTVLFYAIGDALSAGSLAESLRLAGADVAAQLDVNWSLPRFLVYDHGDGRPPRVTESLAPVKNYTADEYVEKPSDRDFFYLVAKDPV